MSEEAAVLRVTPRLLVFLASTACILLFTVFYGEIYRLAQQTGSGGFFATLLALAIVVCSFTVADWLFQKLIS